MAIDAAQIEFAEFQSETVLFASRTAANSFFNDLRVLPAQEDDYGAVRKAANVPPLADATYVVMPIIAGDGTVSTTQVVDKASFDALKAAFDSLLTKLKTATVVTDDP